MNFGTLQVFARKCSQSCEGRIGEVLRIQGTKKFMKRNAFFMSALLLCAVLSAQTFRKPGSMLLPNGWGLSPAGRQLKLGGMPLKLESLRDGRHLLAASDGFGQHFLAVIDLAEEKVAQIVPMTQGWMGITVSPDARLVYASAGGEDRVLVYRAEGGKLTFDHEIPLESGTFPTGLTLNRDGSRLYVAANLSNAVKIVDLKTNRVVNTIPAGEKPYTCAIAEDESLVYVSNWGEDTVSVLALPQGQTIRKVRVREKPNDLALTRDGRRLFVANGNRNTVSVIDTVEQRVTEEIDVALFPNSLPGSTPNALAISPSGDTLYVASADNNVLALIDISQAGESHPRGFIPTGWYPTAVYVDAARNKLVVANGKGTASKPNAALWNESATNSKNAGYVGNLLGGSLSFIDLPDARALARFSAQAHQNHPASRNASRAVQAPFQLGERCPIRYVFYIIKENRTYDNVFGDMKEGNGDPDYCLFPEKVTPNHHDLAREFVLLDNVFHNAEVSASGHHWVTSAYSTDYVEKFWPAMYGGKGRQRPSLHDDPEAYSAAGFLWDLCARAGLSYRSYGEFARMAFAEPGTVRPAMPSLVGHIHPTYYGADGIQQMPDRKRLELWKADFERIAAAGDLQRLTILSLPGDHLVGTKPGFQTPRAMMAENDWALGQIVDTLSHSRFWEQMAIFVVEDDTQGGPDHVDVHRGPTLVLSPYVRRHTVDSTMYSSSSVLRTIEAILGLPAMTQYDAAATPMWASFQAKPDLQPYAGLAARVDLSEMNTSRTYGAQRSIELGLDVADTADDREYNEIIWKAVKGAASPVPPRRVASFVASRP
jgi:YVTN family beta-propeller protein